MRTIKGVTDKEILINFGENIFKHFLTEIKILTISNKIKITNNNNYYISEEDWFISDSIISQLCKI